MSDKKEPNILITGRSSLSGGQLYNFFVNEQKNVKSVGRQSFDDFCLDLSDKTAVQTVLKDFKPDFIFHFASVVPRDGSIDDTEHNAKITRLIDRNIYDMALDSNAWVVYASGTNLYRRDKTNFVDESTPLKRNISSSYLKAKKDGDMLYSSYEKGLVARISSPVNIDRAIVQKLYNQAKDHKEIVLWGDGMREQDFIDVRDITSFVNLFLQNPTAGVFNVAQGKPNSMKELAGVLIEFQEAVIKYQGDENVYDDFYARFSVDKAKSIFNWSPKYSLRDAVGYFLEGR